MGSHFHIGYELDQVVGQEIIVKTTKFLVRLHLLAFFQHRHKIGPYFLQERNIVHNQVDWIIDFMGHPRHQSAQGLHLLRLLKLLLAVMQRLCVLALKRLQLLKLLLHNFQLADELFSGFLLVIHRKPHRSLERIFFTHFSSVRTGTSV